MIRLNRFKLATLTRGGHPSPAQHDYQQPTSQFDTTAVPSDPTSFHRQLAQLERADASDLIDLAEEPLFSGRADQPRQASASTSQSTSALDGFSGAHRARVEGDGILGTPVVTEEVIGSLTAAKEAFLFALSGLLNEHFDSPLATAANSPNLTRPPSPPTIQHTAPTPTTLEAFQFPTTLTPDPDSLLPQLIQRLRLHTAASPLRPATGSHLLVEELQARVDSFAAELPPQAAELGRALGALLACIERLLAISRTAHASASASGAATPVPVAPAAHAPAAAVRAPGSPNVYVRLEREARALQASSSKDAEWPSGLVGAAREVEMAERDLLWGRVDDLSERVGQMCRRRAAAMAEEEETAQRELEARDRSAEQPWSPTLPPTYDTLHHPPAYAHDQADVRSPPASAHSTRQDEKAGPSTQAPQVGPNRRSRRVSGAHTEKMQRDLESVSLAIERLYLVTPQLANQRVEPDRRVLRERQLAKLGNAIERLSKGRLDDQRAKPSPDMNEDPVERHAKLRQHQDQALERLIEQIDRAASRTLLDQRVDLHRPRNKDKAKAVDGVEVGEAKVLSDPHEAERREFILSHTGKGRLAGQDATLPAASSSAFPGPHKDPRAPVSIAEFFAGDDELPKRRASLPGGPLAAAASVGLKKKFSTKSLFPGGSQTDERPPLGERKSSLRLGVLKMPSGVRRGSYDSNFFGGMTGLGVLGTGMSRSSSATEPPVVLVHSPLDFIAEESRNLGTLIVTFWPRIPGTGKEEWEVISVEAESLLVAPAHGGPASRLALPCRVIPQPAAVVNHGGYYECKLVTIEQSPTRPRHDLEVVAPLSTNELRQAMPDLFACAACDARLVDGTRVAKYNALPSEHWAELLDAWMCHQDQSLNQDLIDKGNGIKPRADEGMVGSAYVLFPREVTTNWVTPEKSEPTRAEANDELYPAHCATCGSLVGQHVVSLDPALRARSLVRLVKYATYPVAGPRPAGGPDAPAFIGLRRYSLASHLTSEMLELGQAHACHRFVVEDEEEERPRLLLWLFNPAVRVAFSTASATNAVLGEGRAPSPLVADGLASGSGAPSPARQVARTMNAVKVFYSVVEDEFDPAVQAFTQNEHSTVERLAYPAEVVARLGALLRASSLVYPAAKRRWGEMDAGFLERI